MENSTISISNSISKIGADEEMSLFRASMEDAAGRLADGTETISNERIQKGDEILETYEVTSDAIHGGMGSVWRVHHRNWDADLAMKRPQPRFFAEGSARRREHFIHECEAWINLGLHPNIVSCYYVRDIGGVPAVFSEWMENGSLSERIRDGALYAGTEEEVRARILDLAIQFARGLHYAHETGNGLIHQDVKPDNLLLSKSWDAKVADFGLARARTQLREDVETESAPSSGYTPAYCSSEQVLGEPLTRRTDIYSWAVSVMEMILGERRWRKGTEAGKNAAQYMEQCRVEVPVSLKSLLIQCLEEDPQRRPHDFAEIEEELQKIYRETCGSEYQREVPKITDDTAAFLNNRALSLYDLGKKEEAEKLWEQALTVAPDYEYAVYNQLVSQWYKGEVDDLFVMTRLKELDNNVASRESSEALEAARYCRGKDVLLREKAVNPDDNSEEMTDLIQIPRIQLDAKYSAFSDGSVFFDEDGKVEIRISSEVVYICETSSNRCVMEMKGLPDNGMMTGAHFNKEEGTLLLWGSVYMKLYDLHTGRCVRTLIPGFCDELPEDNSVEHRLDLAGISGDGSQYWYPNEDFTCIRFRRPDLVSPQAKWLLCRFLSYEDTVTRKQELDKIIREAQADLEQKRIGEALEKIEEGYQLLEGQNDRRLEEVNDQAGRYSRICGIRSVREVSGEEGKANDFRQPGEDHSQWEHYFPKKLYEGGISSGILVEVINSDPFYINLIRIYSRTDYLRKSFKEQQGYKKNTYNRIASVRLLRGESTSSDFVITPDFRMIFCRIDKRLCFIMIEEGKLYRTKEDAEKILCVSPDGTRLALANRTDGISIYSISGKKITNEYTVEPVSSVNLGQYVEHSLLANRPWAGCFREDGRAIFLLVGNTEMMINLEDGKQYNIGKRETARKIDYAYTFPGWTDWDEEALPYVELFVLKERNPGYHVEDLLKELQKRGLGYIRPEGVRHKLWDLMEKSRSQTNDEQDIIRQ